MALAVALGLLIGKPAGIALFALAAAKVGVLVASVHASAGELRVLARVLPRSQPPG